MRIRVALAVTAVALSLPLVAQPAPARIDTSGLGLFWQVHDLLARDEEPADSVWDRLWRSPGYALLDAKERRRAPLTRAFRLAYKPSLRDSLAASAGEAPWVRFALSHVVSIPSRRDSLHRFAVRLTEGGAMAEAQRRAEQFLPRGVTERVPPPDVSLIYFVDGRGYPERLLLDPLYFMRISDAVPVLGHELHHYYRNRSAKPEKPYGSDLLAWVLSTTEVEGIAGMVDKADVPGLSAQALVAKYDDDSTRLAYFREYQVEYRRPDYRLRQVEDILLRVGRHPDSTAVLGAWLHKELPDNGRILGAFMAATIDSVYGRAALLNVVGDSFGFWRLYSKAAAQSKAPQGLEGDALEVLEAIERKYRP